MWLFFVWLSRVILTGMADSTRGRSVIGWVILGMLFPLFALVAVLVLGKVQSSAPALAVSSDATTGVVNSPIATSLRKCPECAEWIQREARRCKHCGFSRGGY